MSDVFISYCREDQPTARKLASALERHGFAVWWDPRLRVGERYDDVIEAALRDAKCVIVLWSAESVGSQYVRDEATYALNRNKLFPVAIENVDLPFRFAGLHTAQLQEWEDEDDFPELTALLGELGSRSGAPSSAVPRVEPVRREIPRERFLWLFHGATILLLAFFYFAAGNDACSRDDLVVLSALLGLPLSGFLLFRSSPRRIAWIAAPILTFLIGMPFGHDYGMTTRSPLFGLTQGEHCQTSAVVPVMLGIVLVVAVIDHILVLRANRRRAQ